MKKIGKSTFDLMGKFEQVISMSMIAVAVAITVINVVARYIFKSSIPWSQEVTGIAWTWTCMLGISWCYRRNMHLGVDIFVNSLKPHIRRYAYIVNYAILFVAFVFMTYMSVIITMKGGYKLTNYFQIPYSIKYISAVFAFINMSYYSLYYIYIAITRPEELIDRMSIDGNGLEDLEPEETEEVES